MPMQWPHVRYLGMNRLRSDVARGLKMTTPEVGARKAYRHEAGNPVKNAAKLLSVAPPYLDGASN